MKSKEVNKAREREKATTKHNDEIVGVKTETY